MPTAARRFRPLFPAALLLVGVAASCWLACAGPSLAEQNSSWRLRVRQELAKALPPPAVNSTRASERLRVEGDLSHLQITASGEFLPDSVKAFSDHARRLIARLPQRRMTIEFYSDMHDVRTLVATCEIDVMKELEADLRAHLPPPSSAKPDGTFTLDVWIQFMGAVKYYGITPRGPFTPDGAKAFATYVRQLSKTWPGETRVVLFIYTTVGGGSALLEHFDTANEK